MTISVVFGAMFVACVLGLRLMARHPDWDQPTDTGMRWALRCGLVACPVVAVLGPFLT